MIDDSSTIYIGSYINVRPSSVLEWLLLPFRLVWLCYVVLWRDRHWLLDPHPGESCAPECYRLVVEVNGRRLLAWRHWMAHDPAAEIAALRTSRDEAYERVAMNAIALARLEAKLEALKKRLAPLNELDEEKRG